MAIESPTQDPGSALVQVSSALAEEEANLSEKLDTIREKRRRLRVVIDLFSDPSVHSDDRPTAKATEKAAANSISSWQSLPQPPQMATEEPQAAAESSQPPAPATSAASALETTHPTKKPKWQDYVSPEFRDVSFPKAVEFVLVEHFDEGADAATIMDELFVNTIPDEARRKGRNRLSNVLAVGLQNQKWRRNKAGAYIISQTAANAG
ncbi:MAG: hypothetical protein ACFB8W_02630 [Elainellaceae cyanobacterium]